MVGFTCYDTYTWPLAVIKTSVTLKNYIFKFSTIVFLIILGSCKNERSNTKEIDSSSFENSYFGLKPPGNTPVTFAPGIISTNNWEAGGVFSPDLKEFYFIREVGETEDEKTMNFMVYHYKDNEWRDSIISTRVGQPFISPDGKTMHLGRRYKDRLENGNWSELKNLDSTLYNVPIMRLTSSEKGTYVFDAMGEGLLRYSRLVNGERETPKLFGEEFNSGTANAHPFIAPDESYILWDSRREIGHGGADIYVSFRQEDGSWGKAINLGKEINSTASEGGARVTPDGKYLFFNRNVGKIKPTDKYEDVNMFWVDAKVIEKLKTQKSSSE